MFAFGDEEVCMRSENSDTVSVRSQRDGDVRFSLSLGWLRNTQN